MTRLTLNPRQSALTLPLTGSVNLISNVESFAFQSKSIRVKLDVETKIAAHASATLAKSAFDMLPNASDRTGK